MQLTPAPAAQPAESEQPLTPLELEFLVEFAVAYQRLLSYPPSHPAIDLAADRVVQKLERLFGERGVFSVGVTRDGFLIDDAHTDPGNRVLRAFARKLHDEQLGAAAFAQGIDAGEMHEIITRLVRGSSMAGTPLGLGAPEELVWPHARLFPIAYDKLELSRASLALDGALDRQARGESRQLWQRLARAAMRGSSENEVQSTGDTGESGEDGELPTPEQIASLLNENRGAPGDAERAVAGVLIRLTEEGNQATDSEAMLVGRYLSELIGTLSEETLARLMQAQEDPEQRRRFLMAASEGLAADAMLALTRAAASASKVAISSPMLRMLGKIAGQSAPGSEAEASLRSFVQQSAALWSGAEGAPEEYESLLSDLAAGAPDIDSLRGTMPIDPLSVVAIGLELNLANETVLSAADQMVLDCEVSRLFDTLDVEESRGSEVATILRGRVLRRELMYRFLRSPHVEFNDIQLYASAMGSSAADPLLDLLAAATERGLRSRLLNLLAQLGQEVGPRAAARLSGAPWYVQRNLLEILGRLPSLPPGLSLREPARHPDARVRRAAFKIILRDSVRREEGLLMALEDMDDDILRIALGAALEECPHAAIPHVRRIFETPKLEQDIRAMALRVLAARRDPWILDALIRAATVTRTFLRRVRLQSKGPLMIAALSSLAAHWRSDSRAVRILSAAEASPDPEIRAAVQAPPRGAHA